MGSLKKGASMTAEPQYIITENQLSALFPYFDSGNGGLVGSFGGGSIDFERRAKITYIVRSHPYTRASSDVLVDNVLTWINEELTPLSRKPTMNNIEITFRKVRDKILELHQQTKCEEVPVNLKQVKAKPSKEHP